jgi:hypothetical protein
LKGVIIKLVLMIILPYFFESYRNYCSLKLNLCLSLCSVRERFLKVILVFAVECTYP